MMGDHVKHKINARRENETVAEVKTLSLSALIAAFYNLNNTFSGADKCQFPFLSCY